MSTKKISTTKQGFTIIEVVLVLAIAGLIFLMVFVALPALQRSQRDTQRRDDVGRLVTAVTTFKANTGKMPEVIAAAKSADAADFELKSYVGDFKDPGSSNAYQVEIVTATDTNVATLPTTGNMKIYLGANCENGKPKTNNGGSGYFAVVSYAENGGSICQDNS